jgi:hypothetical protein
MKIPPKIFRLAGIFILYGSLLLLFLAHAFGISAIAAGSIGLFCVAFGLMLIYLGKEEENE